MPRRHQRADEAVPLQITPADLPKPPRTLKTPTQLEAEWEERDQRRAEREKQRRKQAIERAINWDVCLVPECGDRVWCGWERDSDRWIPLCRRHEVMAWRKVQFLAGDPEVIKTSLELAEEERQREVAAKARKLASRDGDIYYVRLNGLIKVGWSRDLYDRLRAYGPDVEILCHHKGSRDDETNLHRNLRPFLARGREWYEDCRAMHSIIAKAVEIHGKPHIKINWTRPAETPIRLRRR